MYFAQRSLPFSENIFEAQMTAVHKRLSDSEIWPVLLSNARRGPVISFWFSINQTVKLDGHKIKTLEGENGHKKRKCHRSLVK